MTTSPSGLASADLTSPPASPEEIRRLVRTLTDNQVAAVVATGASLAEIEVAAAYAQGQGDMAGRTGRPLEGRSAAVFDILSADDELLEPER
jgi:hypothetical protein